MVTPRDSIVTNPAHAPGPAELASDLSVKWRRLSFVVPQFPKDTGDLWQYPALQPQDHPSIQFLTLVSHSYSSERGKQERGWTLITGMSFSFS